MKPLIIIATTLLFSGTLQAQDSTDTAKKIVLPDIPGYMTLKCDFHMHTVFSDGHVWPSFRVHEALRDGMDVISLTEHADFEGHPDELKRDYNRSYEIAVEAAKGKKLLIVQGAEISPRVSPYHNNALFIRDANAIPSAYMKEWKKKFVMKDTMTHEQLLAPFLEVKKQGAFVFYNHPNYSWWDNKDTVLFTPFHKELQQKGILKGVEVVNSGFYSEIAHRMAMEYNLTMMCNTDEHYDMAARYYRTHRPMTLVFAKERTVASIQEALEAKRTACYFDDYIVARQPEAAAFFKASLQVTVKKKTVRKGEKVWVVTFTNTSDIPYKVRITAPYMLENMPLGQTTFLPHQTVPVMIKAVWKDPASIPLQVEVYNILVSPDEALKTSFTIAP